MIRGTCQDCFRPLTAIEREYYKCRCEACERGWLERIEAWRHGADDQDFDEMFPEPPRPAMN